ncbi:coiled-coil domain-containing protein 7 isoform 1-T1 [Thomomys bottae]
MVLRSPPTGESLLQYALHLPSNKVVGTGENEREQEEEDEESQEDDILVRKIARHLDKAITTLIELYGIGVEDGYQLEMKSEEEDVDISVGGNMNSFLTCCSQFAAQLEESFKEERSILESVFKWFQQQVNQMEELSKDQGLLEEDHASRKLSVVHKKLIKKLEHLRVRLQDEHKMSLKTELSASVDTESSTIMKSYEAVKDKIEEFIKSHETKESTDTAAPESQAAYSMMNRLNVMITMFENKSSMLERALNDRDLLESKYKWIQGEFKLLSEEKSVLENELLKVKDENPQRIKPTSKGERTGKKPGKTEKKKEKGKSESLEGRISPVRETNTKENLQVQVDTLSKEADALKTENKALQEQLKQALQEAEKNKTQLDHFLNQGTEKKQERSSLTTETSND